MEMYLVALAVMVLIPGIVSVVFGGFSWDPRRDKQHARMSLRARRAGDLRPAV